MGCPYGIFDLPMRHAAPLPPSLTRKIVGTNRYDYSVWCVVKPDDLKLDDKGQPINYRTKLYYRKDALGVPRGRGHRVWKRR